jgi:hypothetical protein
LHDVSFSLYGFIHCERFVKQKGRKEFMSFQKRLPLVVIGILATVIVINMVRGASGAEPQDPAGLDRRISMLEQRFYRLETSVSRLEQYASSQRSTGSSSDRGVDQLSQEVQRLQLRLNEVECGLLKLDERTGAGNRRSGEARPADPCRQNTGLPLRLPSRP